MAEFEFCIDAGEVCSSIAQDDIFYLMFPNQHHPIDSSCNHMTRERIFHAVSHEEQAAQEVTGLHPQCTDQHLDQWPEAAQ